MSDNFAVAATTQAHAADTEFFVRRGMTKGYQQMSILAIPLYLGFTIWRKGRSHVTVNRMLRATWIGGGVGEFYVYLNSNLKIMFMDVPFVGVAGGGSFEYLRSAYSNPENVRSRRIQAAYNVSHCIVCVREYSYRMALVR